MLADMFAPFQVGDGPGYLEDAGEGAGREAEPELHYNPKIIEFLGYIPFDCPDDTEGRLSWYKKSQVLIDVR